MSLFVEYRWFRIRESTRSACHLSKHCEIIRSVDRVPWLFSKRHDQFSSGNTIGFGWNRRGAGFVGTEHDRRTRFICMAVWRNVSTWLTTMCFRALTGVRIDRCKGVDRYCADKQVCLIGAWFRCSRHALSVPQFRQINTHPLIPWPRLGFQKPRTRANRAYFPTRGAKIYLENRWNWGGASSSRFRRVAPRTNRKSRLLEVERRK